MLDIGGACFGMRRARDHDDLHLIAVDDGTAVAVLVHVLEHVQAGLRHRGSRHSPRPETARRCAPSCMSSRSRCIPRRSAHCTYIWVTVEANSVCSASPPRASPDGADVDEDVGRRAALDALERAVEDVQPSGEQSHELGVRPPVGADASLQARAQPLRRLRRSEEAIEVLGLGEQLEAIVALPEARLGDRRQRVPLLRLRCARRRHPRARARRARTGRTPSSPLGARASVGRSSFAALLLLIDLRLGVGVDEHDLDALASSAR